MEPVVLSVSPEYSCDLMVKPSKASTPTEFTGDVNVRKLLIEFANHASTIGLKEWLSRRTLFQSLRVSRSETVHSAFLAWLLRPDESHGLGDYAMRKLLEALALVVSDSAFRSPESLFPLWLHDEVILGAVQLQDVDCQVEVPIKSSGLGKTGRLDLLVTCTMLVNGQRKPLRVIIENKVSAIETNEQTLLYSKWAEETPHNGTDLLVFLTPLASSELTALQEPECSCKRFLQINYQYLLEYCIEPCGKRITSPEPLSMVSQYIRNLSHPPTGEDKQKGPLVMATGSQERALVRRFWEQNRELLLQVFAVLRQDESVDDEVREIDRSLQSMVEQSSKDYSRHDVLWNDELVEANLAKTDVPWIAIRTAVARLDGISENAFKEMRANKDGAFALLKREDEMTDSERKYKRYRIREGAGIVHGGRTYFVCKNWGGAPFDRILKAITGWFPAISFRPHD